MGPKLLDVIEACEAGKGLLAGKPFYNFCCLPEHENAPVFFKQVRDVAKRGEHKHTFDTPVPLFADLYQPMTPRHYAQSLASAGFAAGLQEPVGTAILRRTWCIKSKMAGEMQSHEIALEMGQDTSDTTLQDVVYRPDHLDDDATASQSGGYQDAVTSASMAVIGTVNQRPNIAEVSEDRPEQLEELSITETAMEPSWSKLTPLSIAVVVCLRRGHCRQWPLCWRIVTGLATCLITHSKNAVDYC